MALATTKIFTSPERSSAYARAIVLPMGDHSEFQSGELGEATWQLQSPRQGSVRAIRGRLDITESQ